MGHDPAKKANGLIVRWSGRCSVHSDAKAVWIALHDPVRLRQCLPDACRVERDAGGRFLIEATLRVGFAALAFSGSILVVDAVAPERYTMVAAGKSGRLAGARGRCTVELEPSAKGCDVRYAATCVLDGPLALLGRVSLPLLARRLTATFVDRFCACMRANHPFSVDAGENAAFATAPLFGYKPS